MSEQSVLPRSKYQICEAVECYNLATEEIDLPVGKLGTIRFYLCHECLVRRFGK
jgi:hypothetical protein